MSLHSGFFKVLEEINLLQVSLKYTRNKYGRTHNKPEITVIIKLLHKFGKQNNPE